MSHASRSYLFKTLLVLMVCATFALAAFAQSTTDGAIAGTVTDQSKAVVMSAKVIVRNIDTNATSTATTDAQGKFRVIRLQPGTYSVTVESSNFAPVTQPSVVVEVGAVTNLELALAVAGSKEIVEVSAEAPTVNTQQQDFSSNINQTSINELPINGRRWSNFALLSPGATPDGNYGLVSFRGISGLLNNSTVDGGDNNQAFFSEERGRTRISYVISQNSVREFQVNTSNYSAEYGRAAGAVVNSVTKSGTNSVHGSAFYYIRDNELGATNPFTTKAMLQDDGSYKPVPFKPQDRRHQFGGSIGGPIVKDKLWYFFNYDGQRRNFPGASIPGSPGKFFETITVGDPQSILNPTTNAPYADRTCANLAQNKKLATGEPAFTEGETAFCRGLTQAQVNQGMAFLAGETGEVPRTGTQDIFFPKLDYKINDRHTVAVSFNRMRWDSPAGVQTQASVNYGPATYGNDYVKADSLNARLYSALTNSISNELRFQWSRDFEYQTSQEPTALEKQYGLTTSYAGRPPYIKIMGSDGINIGRPDFLERYSYPDERRWQWADSMTIAHGKHLTKFGVDLNRANDLMNSLYNGGGTYSYSKRIDFISDLMKPQSCSYTSGTTTTNNLSCFSSFTQNFGTPSFTFHTWDYNFFLQDEWRVLPRLTLNMGLRYEYEDLPEAQIPNPALPWTGKFPSDRNNFGPRFGFAYDVRGNGKTALRGGYGIYYGRIINSTISSAITGTAMPTAQMSFPSFYNNSTIFTGATNPYLIFPNVIPTAPTNSTAQIATVFDHKMQVPQIHQADLILEQEIAKNTVVSVSYLLSLGRELPQFTDINLAAPVLCVPTSTDPRAISLCPKNAAGKPVGSTYQFAASDPYFPSLSVDIPIYPCAIYTSGTKIGQCNSSGVAGIRPNSAFGAIDQISSSVNSNYNALVVQLNRRMTDGLQFQFNYTWSHSLDWGQGSQTFTPTSGTNVYDPYNPRLDYGTSNFDMRHRFVANAVWEPKFFSHSGAVVKAMLDGWNISPIVTISSGRPFTEYISGYNGYALRGIIGSNGSSRLWLLGRNSFRYPMLQNVDLRLGRSFKITEKQRLQVLAEAFNLFNHPYITRVNDTLYNLSTDTTNGVSNFAYSTTGFNTSTQSSSTLYRERQVQFAVRYSF